MATGRAKRVLRGIGIALGVIAVVIGIAWLVLNEPRPKVGRTGMQAEQMAQAMLDSVHDDAWQRTRIVKWTFNGSHHHLWDRTRSFDRYRRGDAEVLLRIPNQSGIAKEHGHRVEGKRARQLVDEAYAAWVNDSFWLNPLAKMHDDGVTRSVVVGGDRVSRLLVSYSSGGLTPGDAYLWTPGTGGAPPTEWQMWVSVLPIGGIRATWERWITIHTGAKISTLHRIYGMRAVTLADVDGRETVRELGGAEDPFKAIIDEDIANMPMPDVVPAGQTGQTQPGEPPAAPMQ